MSLPRRPLRALGVGACLTALASAGAARAEDEFAPEVEAERLVHMLTYVRSDYGFAVRDGVLVSQVEYDEQLGMLDDAARLAAAIQLAAPDTPPLGTGIAAVRELVDALAPSAEVAAAAAAASARIETAMHLADAPPLAPDAALGARLFATQCATCHGATGRGDTPRAASLTPHPVSFHEPAVADALSPARIASTIRFGIAGTAMIPFTFFTDEERWSVAFYASGLRYAGAATNEDAGGYSLLQLASRSDAELREELAERAYSDAASEAALASLRLRAPYAPESTRGPAALARAALRQATAAARAGDPGAARAPLADAAAGGIEVLIASLAAAGERADALDDALLDTRAALDENALREALEARLHTLQRETTYAALVLARPRGLAASDVAATSLGITLRAAAAATIAAAALAKLRSDRSATTRWSLAGATLAGGGAGLFVEAGRVALAAQGVVTLAAALFAAAASAECLDGAGRGGGPARWLGASAVLGVAAAAFSVVAWGAAPLAASGASWWPAALGALVGAAFLAATVRLVARPKSPSVPPWRALALASQLAALLSAGAGAYALERADLLPLRLVALARLPLVGLRPTLATSVAQAAVLVLSAAVTVTLRARRHN